MDIVNESFIHSPEDFNLNVDKFYNNETNVLYITGLSGSGKSTLGIEISKKYNAKHIELDKFEWNLGRTLSQYFIDTDPLIYYISLPENRDNLLKAKEELQNKKPDMFVKEFRIFFKWLVNEMYQHPNQKYVVEGLQIVNMLDADMFKDESIIVKNTSISKSMYQRYYKRNDDMVLNNIPSVLKNYKTIDKQKSQFIDDLKCISLNEGVTHMTDIQTNKSKQNLILSEAAMNKKRKEMEETIYTVFNMLDKTGKNTTKYKQKFSKMSDAEFDKFMKAFLNDDSKNFYLEIEPYEVVVGIEDAEKACDYLGVPLYEHVISPFENPDGEPIVSQYPVPVIYVHMKRVQQMVAKKNTMSIHIDKRDAKTGQVISADKNGRVSDVENISLIAIGANNTMKEMIGARSDDLRAKNEMLKTIRNDGYVSLQDIPSNKTDRVALNTLDTYFLSCGIKTNLVTDSLVLTRNLQGGKDVSSISSKYDK